MNGRPYNQLWFGFAEDADTDPFCANPISDDPVKEVQILVIALPYHYFRDLGLPSLYKKTLY